MLTNFAVTCVDAPNKRGDQTIEHHNKDTNNIPIKKINDKIFNNMNVKLPKERIINIITKYLDRDVEPDYSWGPELHDFYEEDVKRHGSFDFVINDKVSYSYLGGSDQFECQYCLFIEDYLSNRLTNLFGNLWIPIFKEWFEINSGLKVTEMSVFNKLIEF